MTFEVVWSGQRGEYLLPDRPSRGWAATWGLRESEAQGLAGLVKQTRTGGSHRSASWKAQGGTAVKRREKRQTEAGGA